MSWSRHAGRDLRRYQLGAEGLVAHADDVDAAAVVGDFNDHLALFMEGDHAQAALFGLALRLADFGRFDPVIDGVANHVGERIADRLDECLVQFGVLPLHLEANFLPASEREVTNDAGKLAQHVADRLHPRLHHARLQFRGQPVESLHRTQKGVVLVRRAVLQDLIAREHQFADKRHQFVEQDNIDADVGIGDGSGLGFRGGCRRRNDDRFPRRRRRDRCGRMNRRRRLHDRHRWRRDDRRRHGGGQFTGLSRGGWRRQRGRDFARVAQLVHLGDERRIVSRSLAPRRFDARQHFANGVDHAQHRGGDRRIESHFARPQLAEQAFGGMGDRLELDQPHEAGGSFDAVQRAKDLGERVLLGGTLFERNEVRIEQRQVLVRLEQEFAEDFTIRTWSPARSDSRQRRVAHLGTSNRPGRQPNSECRMGPTALAGKALSKMATTPNRRTGSSTLGSVSVVTIIIGIPAVAGFCFK